MESKSTTSLQLQVADGVTVTARVDAPVPPAPGTPGVLLAHGANNDLDHPLLATVAAALAEAGVALTLRFNFPGVGRSGGNYSGRDEYLDVEAALAHLQVRLAGPTGEASEVVPPFPSPSTLPLGLAGYSFGSVMAGLACCGSVRVDALALIAHPAHWEGDLPQAAETLEEYRGPVLAVCGEDDDIAPPGPVERLLSRMDVDFRLEVVPGAGHFFEDTRREVGRLVAEFMSEELGRGRMPS